MQIDRITLHHFRNLHGLDLGLGPGINLIAGQNGLGKSNLLESLHFLCLAHSPRTRRDKELIAWGTKDPVFVIRGEGQVGGKPHTQSVEYTEKGSRVKSGHNETHRLGDLLGHFNLVGFSPEDMDLIRGGPLERRRFLDVLMCQRDPSALEILRRYRQSLRQRNAVLKLPYLGADEDALLLAYEFTLVDAGVELVRRRLEVVDFLTPKAKEFYFEIGGGAEKLHLEMTRSLGRDEKPEIMRENFLQKLRENRAQDRENGATGHGPHRDDLLAFLAGKMARDFASQGQKRSVALALKLASATLLKEASGWSPILLLDDVFAELDPHRRERFGALISGFGQVFIATPRREDLPFPVDQVLSLDRPTE